AHFFGRGIVDPLDDMRVTNPPSNPELLDALAKDLVENKYSLKHLVRTICTSRTYQLSSAPNEFNKHDKQNYARYYPKRMGAEVQNKLARAGGRADALANPKDGRPDAEKVEELFYWAWGHGPTKEQLDAALAHIGKQEKNKKAAYENILWALVNTKEFVFNQ